MRRIKKLSSDAVLDEHALKAERFKFLRKRLGELDVEEVWSHLERELTLGEARLNLDVLHRSLDLAEANLRRAGMLHQMAVEQADLFEMHWRAAYSGWSADAREELEFAKKDKRVSGQVTVDQVENWIAANIPAYREWRQRKRDLDRDKALTKQMHEAWQSRGASLRKQADLVMARRGLDPSLMPRRGKKGKAEDE